MEGKEYVSANRIIEPADKMVPCKETNQHESLLLMEADVMFVNPCYPNIGHTVSCEFRRYIF